MIQEKLNPFKNSFQSVVLMSASQKFEKQYDSDFETGIIQAGIEIINEYLISDDIKSYDDIYMALGFVFLKRNELYPHKEVRVFVGGLPMYKDAIENKPFTFTEFIIALDSISRILGHRITTMESLFKERHHDFA